MTTHVAARLRIEPGTGRCRLRLRTGLALNRQQAAYVNACDELDIALWGAPLDVDAADEARSRATPAVDDDFDAAVDGDGRAPALGTAPAAAAAARAPPPPPRRWPGRGARSRRSATRSSPSGAASGSATAR